ncbi:hypothetical protein J2S13_002334 [Oikeobacillus pervagus]|uniref:SLH domain-containing protein n=1 Tax=Oikeobacillus pervagus TaxID=1325931 RepID=A0AAJ1SZV0_9BACI|nr:S-layer homology domain-containing protein [Oikeobacillus pervagus]MDQ0215914.1 hypothetical protein [Oikeobacillus pervagus]
MANQPKSYRKFLAGSVTAALVASAVTPAFAAEQTKTFKDENESNFKSHSENIYKAAEKGLINGYTDGTFKAYKELSRGDVVKILARYLEEKHGGKVDTSDVKPFDDVRASEAEKELYEASLVVKKFKAFEGSNNKLLPANNITRQAMAKVLVNTFELKEVADGEMKVKDLESADAEFRPYIETLSKAGVTTVENFLPKSTVKRGQYATFLVNALNALEKKNEKKDAKVESVSAVNGKLTVKLSKELDATPISSDFKVVQNINGSTKAVAASSVAYDEATKTVTLVVPELSATEVDQAVSYTVAYKETAAVSSNSFTIAKVGELQATSATQISSTQIKVQFNQKVTKASAEKIANYKLGKAKADGKISGEYQSFTDDDTTAVLQEDEQSVVITLGAEEQATNILGAKGQFDNNTAFLLNVSTNVLPKLGKAAEKPAELPFTLNDSTKPAVEKFVVNENGELVVSFNEKLNTTSVKVVINGQELTKAPVYSAKTGKSTVTFTKEVLTGKKPTGFGLELGKTYAVSVAEGQDAYGTAMNIYTSQFTYTVAADAPQVTKVESKNEKSVTVTFSEPVFKVKDGSALDSTSFDITKGAKHFKPADVTSNTAGTVYTLTFNPVDQVDDFIFDSYKNETSVSLDIHVSDIKDNVGNITPASKHTVTVLKDTVKPEVVKKENKENGFVGLTFNKAFNGTKVTKGNVAGKAYVLTSTGVKLPLAEANVTEVTPTPEGKLKFNLSNVSSNALAAGNYTLVLEEGAVVDTALNGGNKNNEIRVPFIIAATGLEKKPVVESVNASDENAPGNIVVTFEEQVSYESAAKAANYTLDGKAIPASSEFSLDSEGKVLTITLPEATYKESGSKVLKINGVRNLAGTVMDQYEAVLSVNENEKIELKSAKIVNGDVILTFNENVNKADVKQVFVDTDLLVKANGVTVASPTVKEHDAVKADDNDSAKIAKNQIKIVAPKGISFATGTITIEVKEDAQAKDKAGNGAKAVTVTATR